MQEQKFGKYIIKEELGSGAYATVLKAYDTTLDRLVALKLLKPELSREPETRQRFLQEARTLAKLEHPNIAWVYEIDQVGSQDYIAIKFIDGASLEKYLRQKGTLSWEEAFSITRDIANALQFAHDRGLIHRDVKPGNIILGPQGAVLTDFGLVKSLDGSMVLSKSTSQTIGTWWYMATEIIDEQPATPASDQFSLACTLVEMLTGKSPFYANTPVAVSRKHDRGVELPDTWPGGVPVDLTDILKKALDRNPANRFKNMGAFIEVLTKKPQAPKPETPQAQPQSQPRIAPVQITTAPTPKLSASKNEISIPLPGGLTMEFVRVPAGEFSMGSEDGRTNERPVHKVYLDDYWMGKYPVTNAQYKAYVTAAGVKPPRDVTWYKDPNKANHPVVYVSWHNAQAFCQWLSQSSGKRIALPTEAQWEKAARGTDGRTYPWGNQSPSKDLCNYNEHLKGTSPVNQYPAGISPYGCYDMSGNVCESCMDWYDQNFYKNSPAQNPAGSDSGIVRVLRGGSWGIDVDNLRAANRFGHVPGDTYSPLSAFAVPSLLKF